MINPSINYYIVRKSTQIDKFRLIMSVCWEGKRLIYYTGIELAESQWDRKEKKVVNLFNQDAVNAGLVSFKKKVTDLHRSLSIRYGEVTNRHFKDELSRIRINPGYTLTSAFIEFMEVKEDSWSRNTFLKCRSFYPKLEKFTGLRGASVSIESADSEFLVNLGKFLEKEGLSEESCYSYLNLFKWFLSWADENDMIINKDFRNFRLKSIYKEKPPRRKPLYLTREELLKLMSCNPGKKTLEYTRDIYCFMAFTGCSLREVQELKKTDVDKNRIEIRGKKPRLIPVNSYNAEIVRRYENKYYRGGGFFPYISKMSLNKYIRELADFLKFDRELGLKRRGKLVNGRLQDLITINSAKWTFYYNVLIMGLAPGIAAKWSAVKSLKPIERIKENLEIEENYSVSLINRDYEDSQRSSRYGNE